jgi:hypothetical protein
MSERTGEIANLRHRLIAIGEFEQVEIGIRHEHVLGLTADPAAHIDITIGTAARRIHVQAHAGILILAHRAASARDVERHGNEIAEFERFDIVADLDHFAGDFMAEHEADRRRRAPAHHMLIGSADIRADDLENHAMADLAAARIHHLRIVDLLHVDLARPMYTTPRLPLIACLRFVVDEKRRCVLAHALQRR